MRQSLFQTFATPVLLVLATLAGLIIGLVGEGRWDYVATALLCVPVVVTVRALSRKYEN